MSPKNAIDALKFHQDVHLMCAMQLCGGHMVSEDVQSVACWQCTVR